MQRRHAMKQTTHEAIMGWVYASPWVVGFLLLTVGPMLFSLAMSFTDYNMFTPPTFIGLENYARMFRVDHLVWTSLWVTTKYALLSVPLNLVLGFLLALLLNQKVFALGIWRTIFYLPAVLSGVAVLILWLLLLNPDFGMINSLLKGIGIQGPRWLGDTDWALPSLVLMGLWGAGQGMLIYLAGLQGIPTELYEAATVDGAGDWTKFFRITIPMMSPVIFFNTVMGIIGALQTFESAYIMTKGGPAWATYFFMLHLYTTAFEELRMGYASGLAWVLFIYILLLTLLVFRFGSAYVYYESAIKKGK